MGAASSKNSSTSPKSTDPPKDGPILSILMACLQQDSTHGRWEEKIQLEQLINITATFLTLLRQLQQMQRLLNATAADDDVMDQVDEEYMRHLYAGFTPVTSNASDLRFSDYQPTAYPSSSFTSSNCLCSCAECHYHTLSTIAVDDYIGIDDSLSGGCTDLDNYDDDEGCSPKKTPRQDGRQKSPEKKDPDDRSTDASINSSPEESDADDRSTDASFNSQPEESDADDRSTDASSSTSCASF